MSINTATIGWNNALPDHGFNAIGSFNLPVGVQWDKGQFPQIAQALDFTLGGIVHNRSAAVTEGQRIQLVVAYPYCWFNNTRYDELRALESTLGASYTFSWRDYQDDGTTLDTQYTVIFDHSQGQAVNLGRWPGQNVRVPVDMNLFVGQINLMRVN